MSLAVVAIACFILGAIFLGFLVITSIWDQVEDMRNE